MKNCLAEGPHYRTPHKLLKTQLYNQWLGTADCRIFYYLIPNVIRAPMSTGRLNKLYEKYFLEHGILTATARQKDIAEFLGLADHSPISKNIARMVEQGIIIEHKDSYDGKSMKVYELGYLSEPPERNQLWHAHLYFYKEQAELDLQKKFI